MNRLRNWLLGALVSGLALAIALWGVQPQRLWQVTSQARLIYALPAALFVVLGLLARARSWHILLQGEAGYRRAFWALNEGYLLNSVLPLRLGELGRAYSVSRGLPLRTSRAFASVVVERLIDVAVSLAALIWSLTLITAPSWAGQLTTTASLLLAGGVLGTGLLVLSRQRILAGLRRLPLLKSIGVLRAAEGFTSGLTGISRIGLLARSTGWSATAWMTAWAQLAAVFTMFGLSGRLEVYVFVMGVTAFGAAIPSSPGALGVFELSMVAAMLVSGYSREVALGVAVVMHLLQIGITAILGALALAQEGQTLVSLAGHARQLLSNDRNEVTA